MRIGIGLPAAIPESAATGLGNWAATSERLGFCSVSVIDRLVYDNIDPLIALTAAAACTERIELMTTVLNVPHRRNPVMVAKQLASIDRISGGRLTAGLALGGWPEDYAASDLAPRKLGAVMDAMVAAMQQVWDGKVVGASGPIPALDAGRPGLLFGGFAPASFARAATVGQGWVAPSFGLEALVGGVTGVREAWTKAGRSGQPRFVVERYFCLGERADEIADHYIDHYYGDAYFAAARADTLTTPADLQAELDRVAAAGATDCILLPCSDDISQAVLLGETLDQLGIPLGFSPLL